MVAALKTKVTSLNCYDGDSVAITYDDCVAKKNDDGSGSNDDGNVAKM